MSLLLRVDAEQCWLHREVIPALRDVETSEELPEEQVGAALAYLEAMWSEATIRAHETDAAHAHLHSSKAEPAGLAAPASHYHAAVRVLRGILAERVMPLMDQQITVDEGRGDTCMPTLRLTDTRRPPTGGRAPWAA
jgi:hypothetical protein